MNEFLQYFFKHVAEQPEREALFYEPTNTTVTYAELDQYSSQVCCYLQQQHIGPEDFVIICLPRGVEPIICVMGILKAGAAFVLLEDDFPAERTTNVIKDCHCKLVLNYAVWETIIHEPAVYYPLSYDEYTAAFAIYTSGSTGQPKGVLHEYGSIMTITKSLDTIPHMDLSKDDSFTVSSPLNYIATLIVIFTMLYCGGCIHVLPYAVIKDIQRLTDYLLCHRITRHFFPPMYAKLYTEVSPWLRTIFLGGDAASHIFIPGVSVLNVYASSESGYLIATFPVDKEYDVTPIGKPAPGFEITLAADGEIIIPTPFTRGYINQPEAICSVFTPDRHYHTGDMGQRLPDGNYILRGRSNNMIKINGNRVELTEIENTIKKVLKLDWACAKAVFKDGHSHICVYSLTDFPLDKDSLLHTLSAYLPYYMIPSHFIKIDHIPVSSNGKLDRKQLPLPRISEQHAVYEAPTTPVQEELCRAFRCALNQKTIGIQDDFFQLGGDSLASIQLLLECRLKNLTAEHIRQGRTPAGIALLYESAHMIDLSEQHRLDLLAQPQKLTIIQRAILHYQAQAPDTTMHNLFLFVRLGPKVNSRRFACALEKTICHHPALLTIFSSDSNNHLVNRYSPQSFQGITVESIEEAELKQLADTLVQPFPLMGLPLFRARVFQTPEAVYFFFDVHHVIFDGLSFRLLLHDLDFLYQHPESALPPDYYYNFLADAAQKEQSPLYQEAKHYFEEKYSHDAINSIPEPLPNTTGNRLGILQESISLEHCPAGSLAISDNVLFITAVALALSAYQQKPQVQFEWIFHGRQVAWQTTAMGLFIHCLPLKLQLPPSRKLADIIADVKQQVSLGEEYCCYPYAAQKVLQNAPDEIGVIFQNDLRDISTLCQDRLDILDIRQNKDAVANDLDIEINKSGQDYTVVFLYNSVRYDEAMLYPLLALILEKVQLLSQDSDFTQQTIGDISTNL